MPLLSSKLGHIASHGGKPETDEALLENEEGARISYYALEFDAGMRDWSRKTRLR